MLAEASGKLDVGINWLLKNLYIVFSPCSSMPLTSMVQLMSQLSITAAEKGEVMQPHADGVAPKAEGPHVPWTSGILRPAVKDAAQVCHFA